ncbi:MAG TPA: NAD-dependent epimerase/dehydratase family protein [Chthoniobacterales bacterium]|nr:NAD-dependent epimerase/dehydratase family protein [Chthoniobacterales bacterium]
MPSVLIAGHGYLGQAAADLFEKAGWQVEGWTKSPASSARRTVRAVDIADASQVSASTAEFDVVIHSASTRGGDVSAYRSLYFDGAANLVRRFQRSVLLLVGSTSVYAQQDGSWVTEESPAQPEHERGRILRETEQFMVDNGGIVARLGGICGPRRSYLLEKFLDRTAVIDPSWDRYINQIHRDDAASALLALAGRADGCAGQIFNVTDNAPMLHSECYRWLAKKLGRAVPPNGPSVSSGKRGRSNKRVSNAKLRGLGWSPVFPTFPDAMEKSILPSFGL